MKVSCLVTVAVGLATAFISGSDSFAQSFVLPTANRALLDRGGGGERFYVGTIGKPWTSGMFGCTRTSGLQMHEGIDIRCLKRDADGEPADDVLAAADGTVAYVNSRSALSAYGKYVILRHTIDELEVYSLYAHLSEVRKGVEPGRAVKAGAPIAVMGRTSNTRERISKERAHLHFEIGLLVTDRFASWFKKMHPKERNDHGIWNGLNFLGLDPSEILTKKVAAGQSFDLLNHVRNQDELCRVLIRDTSFPWLKRYTRLIKRNPVAEKQGVVAYEAALNFNGVPFQLIPRAASEVSGSARFQLLSVKEAEAEGNRCRKLVTRRNGRWEIGSGGMQLLELLTY